MCRQLKKEKRRPGNKASCCIYTSIIILMILHIGHKDHDEDIGYLGITAQVISILAMFAAGRILDWTKAF